MKRNEAVSVISEKFLLDEEDSRLVISDFEKQSGIPYMIEVSTDILVRIFSTINENLKC